MARIFLSYAREDRPFAEMLARVMESAGHNVWWDRRIDGGSEFSSEIEAALADADVVLVAWSADSVKSRWVKDEASVGGDSGRLIPLSIDGTTPPMGFRQFQTIDLIGWKGGKRDGRTDALNSAVARRTAELGLVPTPTTLNEAKRARKQMLLSLAGVAAALLLLAIGVGAFLYWRGQSSASGSSLLVDIVPLDASGQDRTLQDLAAQTRDSLGEALSDQGIVVHMVSAGRLPSKDSDLIISGRISRTDQQLVTDIRVDQADNNITVYSRRLEIDNSQARILPGRVAAQIAGTIAWARPLIALERHHPSNPPVTSDLLRQLDFTADPLQSLQIAKRAYQTSPNSSFAQIAYAFAIANNLSGIPKNERTSQVAAARKAAAEALASAPEFGDVYALPCLLQSEVLLSNCEARMLDGLHRDPQAPFLDAFLSVRYWMFGRLAESQDLVRLSYSRNPYVPTKLGWMMRVAEFSGNSVEADKAYAQGLKWWPEFAEFFVWNRLNGLLERGDFKRMKMLVHTLGADAIPNEVKNSAGLVDAIASGSATETREACSAADKDYWPYRLCMVGLAKIGDADRAFAMAEWLYPTRVGRSAVQTEQIWLDEPDPVSTEYLVSPSAAPLRLDPRFVALAQRVGLLAYWRTGKKPDFCVKSVEPVCPKLLAKPSH